MKFLKNTLLFVLLLDILVFVSIFGWDKNKAAAVLIEGFGGRIQNIKPCVKPPGLMLTVGPPKGGTFYLGPQSRIYDYAHIIPNVWVRGNIVKAPVACRGLNRNISGFKFAEESSIFGIKKAYALSEIGKEIPGFKNLPIVKLLKSFGPFKKRHLRTLRSDGYILKIGTSRF